jgi:hypothetical protein
VHRQSAGEQGDADQGAYRVINVRLSAVSRMGVVLDVL